MIADLSWLPRRLLLCGNAGRHVHIRGCLPAAAELCLAVRSKNCVDKGVVVCDRVGVIRPAAAGQEHPSQNCKKCLAHVATSSSARLHHTTNEILPSPSNAWPSSAASERSWFPASIVRTEVLTLPGMATPPDFIALARGTTREEFGRLYPHYFLLGETVLSPPGTAHTTGAFEAVEETNPGQWTADYTEVPDPIDSTPRTLHVFAVRKTQSQWPSMITVGRTRNNDIVLNDVSVSKFHAYFRAVDDHLEIADAGSLIGTWVGATRLPPKGAPMRVVAGQTVRFAHHEFHVHTAEDCWTRLRAQAINAPDGGSADGSV